jgi:hypothetical protein
VNENEIFGLWDAVPEPSNKHEARHDLYVSRGAFMN